MRDLRRWVAMGTFEDETAVEAIGEGAWRCRPNANWNIGDNANGGYAVAPVLRALAAAGHHPDPLSVTTQFLRPLRPSADTDAHIFTDVVREGRTTSVARGVLEFDGAQRLTVLAAFGDLSRVEPGAPALSVPAPPMPPPERCLDRSQLEQGLLLPILERLDVRIHPDRAAPGGSEDAVMEGWIRFRDGTDPSSLALVLFADAFPPALYPRFGRVGWVPTIELTVHVRRQPAPGWVRARLECDDLVDGRMIETGSLWDSTGALVARSRQLGLMLAAR